MIQKNQLPGILSLLMALLVGVIFNHNVRAQEILLDKVQRIGSLTCFQSYDDPKVYYYLPHRPHIARDEKGQPEFSFLKYVQNVKTTDENETSGGIKTASGGGVVHFLVSYDVPEEEINSAEIKLKKKIKDARIAGSIIFQSGTFGLVTSIKDESGEFSRQIVGIGNAPLIEGNKAAISMNLTPKGASLLWESFKMDNPDISIVFEMEILGYRNPYQATLEVDWSKVYHHKNIQAGAKILWVGADVDVACKNLVRDGAIKITAKGENSNMDKILNRAHSKVMDMMFKKVEPEKKEKKEKKSSSEGFFNTLGKVLSGKFNEITLPGVSLFAGYELKNIKESGTLVMDLNQYSQDRLTTILAGNIGSLYQKYGQDSSYFRAANLDDPVFKQREIFLVLDGRNARDFKDYINFVTVQILKEHQNGQQTVDEVVIDQQGFSSRKNRFKMVYGWKEDHDRERWLKYKYKTLWNFRGDAQYVSQWKETAAFVINVAPPYEYRRITLEADQQIFKQQGVRHALVKFYHEFYGKEITTQQTIRTREGVFSKLLEYNCPRGNYDFSYEITWYLKGGKRLQSKRISDSGDIIYLDELPGTGT